MKFNKASEGISTTNYMGAKAFKQSAQEELVFSVLSSFIEDSYYESSKGRIERISSLVKQVAEVDPLFVAKLAIITRRDFHMRSAFHVLVGELAKIHKGDSLVSNIIFEGSERVDDLIEIVAYSKKPIPNGIKKGVRRALGKFNAYQLAKYRGEGKDYSLVDLFNLLRPKPGQGQEDAFKKLIAGELRSTDTWEARLSGGEDKAAVWKDMITNDKIGYMALLRNLRNIAEQADSETIKAAAERISNWQAVKMSKQLPFRFLSAYLALDGKSEAGLTFEKDLDSYKLLKGAIREAAQYSVDNLPAIEGRTVILSDNSGSMRGDGGGSSAVSAMSKRTTADIANLFAVLYWLKANNTIVGLFGDRLITPRLDRTKDVFENFKIINREAEACGSDTETGIFAMMNKLIDEKIMVDRIVIFSDCQVGTGCKWYDTSGRFHGADFNRLFQIYKQINPNVKVYSIDLKGYGNKMFADGVVLLTGWSDKIFDLMEIIEKKEGLVRWIEQQPINL